MRACVCAFAQHGMMPTLYMVNGGGGGGEDQQNKRRKNSFYFTNLLTSLHKVAKCTPLSLNAQPHNANSANEGLHIHAHHTHIPTQSPTSCTHIYMHTEHTTHIYIHANHSHIQAHTHLHMYTRMHTLEGTGTMHMLFKYRQCDSPEKKSCQTLVNLAVSC